MWSSAFNWLAANQPTILLILLTVIITAFFTSCYHYWKGRIEATEKNYRTSETGISRLEERLGQTEKNCETYAAGIARIDHRIEQLIIRFEIRFEQIEARFERIEDRLERVEDRFEQIESRFEVRFELIESRLGQLEMRFVQMEDRLSTLVQAMNAMLVYLKSKDKTLDLSLFKTLSPITFTEAGLAVLEVLNGKQIVNDNLETLFRDIDAQYPATALDVQQYAPIAISKISSGESFKAVKNYIYVHSNFIFIKDEEQHFITLDLVVMNKVLGLYLRDQYLQAHPYLIPEDN